jgi:hypothetical protein
MTETPTQKAPRRRARKPRGEIRSRDHFIMFNRTYVDAGGGVFLYVDDRGATKVTREQFCYLYGEVLGDILKYKGVQS